MDLSVNTFGNPTKPKGNFDVFDSLGNSTQSDLIGGLGSLELGGNNQ